MAHGWPEATRPGEAGGTELYAAALAEAQARAGETVDHWAGRFPGRDVANPAAESAFETAFSRARPDVVHVHHLTGLSMRVPELARRRGARVVMTLHDYWLACARGQLVDADLARCPGPDVDRCARCLSPSLLGRRLPLRKSAVVARRAALASLQSAVDLFLTPSRHLPARVGIDAVYEPLPLLAPVPVAPPAGPGPVRLLFVGALIPTKGPLVAIEAFARLPAGAATLRIVGPPRPYDGSLRYADAVARRAAEVPGVAIGPAVPHAGMAAVYADADVLVFPSTWDENSPLVLREAAAAGLRVVASDVPGVAEGAPDAVRFEPGSVEALRRALAAEVRRGRARALPPPVPTMASHAAAVLAHYRRLIHA